MLRLKIPLAVSCRIGPLGWMKTSLGCHRLFAEESLAAGRSRKLDENGLRGKGCVFFEAKKGKEAVKLPALRASSDHRHLTVPWHPMSPHPKDLPFLSSPASGEGMRLEAGAGWLFSVVPSRLGKAKLRLQSLFLLCSRLLPSPFFHIFRSQ